MPFLPSRLMFELADSIASCLDRDSARRINRLRLDDKLWKQVMELHAKDQQGTLTPDEEVKFMMALFAVNFLPLLQRKCRAILRRPAKPAPDARTR